MDRRNRTSFEARRAAWHDVLVRELRAVSPAMVYDPVAGGDTSAAPVLRELRVLGQQIARAHSLQLTAISESARQRRRHLEGLGRSARCAGLPDHDTALDTASAIARLREVAQDAQRALRAIERNRRYRDVPTPAHGPTLYQAHDVSRSNALRQALRGAQFLANQLRGLPARPASRTVRAHAPVGPGRAELPLSTLYERWVYLQILRAFQPAMGDSTAARTLLDLELAETEGAQFHSQGRIIRIRFEPWILSREIAIASGHALYRAGSASHAWRPDTIIQIEDGVRAGIPIVRHVYVIDAKLTTNPRTEVWDQVAKYRHIRASITDDRVVRMVALALPSVRPMTMDIGQPLDRVRVAARVLALLPGDESGASSESLQRLVREVLAATAT